MSEERASESGETSGERNGETLVQTKSLNVKGFTKNCQEDHSLHRTSTATPQCNGPINVIRASYRPYELLSTLLSWYDQPQGICRHQMIRNELVAYKTTLCGRRVIYIK